MAEPHVVILGAGPAGIGGAYQLRRRKRARVTVVEQRPVVGGNSGSFEWSGQRLDYGSHRLHPACDPEILDDIKGLLGDDLLRRPRHGRILLRGKWVHFPLKASDLLRRLDRAFAFGVVRDMVAGVLPKRIREDSFAEVLRANLGPTICDHFYFPYAHKIWGRAPHELSGIQARRRVSASSFSKLVRKLLPPIPGLKRVGFSHFYYPRRGYGQISEAYAAAAESAGATFLLGWRLDRLERTPAGQWTVNVVRNGESRSLQADFVWSTVPIPVLASASSPPPPRAVLEAAQQIEYRAMILVYLRLPAGRFTEFDAHYFPGADIAITRLSEPKNYCLAAEPKDHTVVCAELPCSPDDEWWSLTDEDLGRRVLDDLRRAGLPVPNAPDDVVVKRLRHAYPVYKHGYETALGTLEDWVETLPGLLSYGRQGLFAHDNTHHALYMAYSAADCLAEGVFDSEKWKRFRAVFATHVVED